MTATPDLEKLMERYQDGDASALRELYRLLAGPMLGYLTRFSGDRGLAEEALQETFVKVHKVRHTYQRGRPLRPWMYAIARHVAVDELRRRKRRREVGDSDEVLEAIPGEDPREAPGQRDPVDLEAALATLPAAQREALVMTKLNGLSVREAAAALNSTEGAVKVKVHRAMQKLRERLGGKKRTPATSRRDEAPGVEANQDGSVP